MGVQCSRTASACATILLLLVAVGCTPVQYTDINSAALASENVDRVSDILVAVQSTATRLDGFAAELGATRSELDRLLGRANALLEEDTGKLDHAIDDLHHSLEAFARHSDAVAHDLETTARNLAEFSQQLRENPSVLIRGRDADGGGQP